CYPLHLGVTEAGDGEDGRIKSAIGIGTLMEDGIGDTIRVSLTEEPEYELPVCRELVERYNSRQTHQKITTITKLAYIPTVFGRRKTKEVLNLGDKHVPVVIADYAETVPTKENLAGIGYRYIPNERFGKWRIGDAAADYIYVANKYIDFLLPETLRVICDAQSFANAPDKIKYFPLFIAETWLSKEYPASALLNFVSLDADKISDEEWEELLSSLNDTVVLCLYSSNKHAMSSVREKINDLMLRKINNPVILCVESYHNSIDEQLIHFSTEAGALFLEGMGDGIWIKNHSDLVRNFKVSGRTYMEVKDNHQFLNNTAFSILQATRTRISKTEYISCPSCGRTLFDLQQTTEKIRERTNHLKGVKIAVMGCIVNGPGEMADADFGYVGAGPGRITLYKGKEVVKR
ncbi:MAG: flavodoxin-dependent (E)-4-hydroxy-3-methylbut-2-enyl-diphosphate synthase, partial [Chitinophagaceae bacterium]